VVIDYGDELLLPSYKFLLLKMFNFEEARDIDDVKNKRRWNKFIFLLKISNL
jgi:hypothetical protein